MKSFFDDPKGKVFFEQLAGRYPKQVALLDAGKLFNADGWGNVRRHCLVQAAAMEILGELLHWPAHDIELVARVAACHDYRKRADKRPDDFTAEEFSRLQALFAEADLDHNLLNSTNPFFTLRFVSKYVPALEEIQFIIDDITGPDGTLISFDERIDEVSKRNPNPEPAIQGQLGRPYWDVEREIGHIILTYIFMLLRENGVGIEHPFDLPHFLNEEIAKRIEAVEV